MLGCVCVCAASHLEDFILFLGITFLYVSCLSITVRNISTYSKSLTKIDNLMRLIYHVVL